jgi:glycosyltransferase involved in cell wall biosynthesis
MGEFERSFKSFRKEIFVRPQGIYLKNAFDGRREEAREMLRVKLGLEKSARIILGCGSACLKKGVDLFFEVASQIYTENKGLECHFVWLGEWDLNLRSDLIKTAKEKGYYNKLILIDFEDDPSLFFAGADAFLLTSRQDPFPSVVLNAMDCGVPVIAFDKSGGSSEILARQQGVVVPYLDVLSMRRELIKLLIDDQFYMNISENSRKAVKDRFIFKDYIKFLLDQLQDNDK